MSRLTALTYLGMADNDLSSLPQALEPMVLLRVIDLSDSTGPLQVVRPLTFLLMFPALSHVDVHHIFAKWNGLSMYYIGQLEAAIHDAFKDKQKPVFGY